jgi:glycosyltransferase involved in cell wall biosynthesis
VIRVGIDGRELAAGVRTGIGRYVIEVLRAASQSEVECIVYGDLNTRLPITLPKVTLQTIESRWTQWWDQVSLPLQLARDRISVLLSPYYKGPLYPPCPVVVSIHDLYFIQYPRKRWPAYGALTTRLARLYARRAAAIIADSEYSKRSIVERLGVSPGKVTVIPVGLGPEFKPELLTESAATRYGIVPPYILYVGNFQPHKNLPRLIRAYANLGKSLRDTHQLVLSGGDMERRQALEGLVRELGIVDRVRFPGLIEDSHLPAVYSGCALFVLPSLEEGFGLPALEAMACGAPVVAGNRAAIPEVVGKAAMLVDPENIPAMTEAMAQVLSVSHLRGTLRQSGLARALEFSSDRTSGRVLALLNEVCRS